MLGLSGLSGDIRDLEDAAAQGDERAEVALKSFVAAIRHYLGGYLTVLGGVDAVVFTGGIGENSQRIRGDVCRNMQWAGIHLDPDLNGQVDGETCVSHADSAVAVWVVPTNEELVVARQAAELIGKTQEG